MLDDSLQTITITSRCARRAHFGKKRANIFPAAKNEGVFRGNTRYGASFGISLPKRARQFRRRGTQNHTITNDGDEIGKCWSLGSQGVIAKPAISATFAVEWRTQKREPQQSDDRLQASAASGNQVFSVIEAGDQVNSSVAGITINHLDSLDAVN